MKWKHLNAVTLFQNCKHYLQMWLYLLRQNILSRTNCCGRRWYSDRFERTFRWLVILTEPYRTFWQERNYQRKSSLCIISGNRCKFVWRILSSVHRGVWCFCSDCGRFLGRMDSRTRDLQGLKKFTPPAFSMYLILLLVPGVYVMFDLNQFVWAPYIHFTDSKTFLSTKATAVVIFASLCSS